eukprot:tig00020542_g10444.t1
MCGGRVRITDRTSSASQFTVVEWRYTPTDGKGLRMKVLLEAARVRERLKKALHAGPHRITASVALTCDLWTSRANDFYMNDALRLGLEGERGQAGLQAGR